MPMVGLEMPTGPNCKGLANICILECILTNAWGGDDGAWN